MSIQHNHEDDKIKVILDKRGYYYHVNAWMRASRRHAWRHVIIEHVHLSYLAAVNEFNDHGAVVYAYRNQVSVLTEAA